MGIMAPATRGGDAEIPRQQDVGYFPGLLPFADLALGARPRSGESKYEDHSMVGGLATPWQALRVHSWPPSTTTRGGHGDDSVVCGDYDDLVFTAASFKPPTFFNCFLAVS